MDRVRGAPHESLRAAVQRHRDRDRARAERLARLHAALRDLSALSGSVAGPCRSTSSTAPTSCSATSSRCRRTSSPTGRRWARCAACSPRWSGLLEEGATHVGVATDHVIESFRNDLYPGYKTGAGIDPALRSAVRAARGAARRGGLRGVAARRVRGRRRARRGRRARRRRPRASRRSGSARPTRTSRSACAARASCSSTAASAPRSTRPACARSSASTPSRSPTISRWSATAPTASRACPAGARSRRRPCSARYGAPREDPGRGRRLGRARCAAPAGSPPRSPRSRERRAAVPPPRHARARRPRRWARVDDWRWRGPIAGLRGARGVDRRRAARRALARLEPRALIRRGGDSVAVMRRSSQ